MTATILGRRNNWWLSGKSSVDSAYKIARDELKTITDSFGARRIQIIIGPRRVGKSTLMQQAIGRLLKDGVAPKRILFFSCDDPTLFDEKTSIGDIIECYAYDVLHEAVSALSSRVYVFIDEIHTLPGWQLWLKNYYEPGYNIKFIVSGSSASHLFDGARESLLGRADTLRLMPLSFIQFCGFWSAYRETDKVALFLEAVPNGSLYTDPCGYYDELANDAWKWDGFKPYVNSVLQEFLLIGGYPEYFSDNSVTPWQKRLVDDIIGHGLYRDIVSIYRIRTPDKLEKLLYFIAASHGQDFNMKTIADTIGCDNETVSTYLTYLSQAYMTIVLSNFSPNAGKILRKNKTLYVLDNGIANAMLRLPEIDDTRAGHIVEGICARDALAACENNLWSLYYWRDKGAEVDLVMDRKTDVLPIEVKYRTSVDQTSIPAFRQAFADMNMPISIVITKDRLDRARDMLYIPFWLTR
ncbi:MAG: ATP-binding protein [Oscillospiraceae bacterium]|nr:ATP-binding protein [Oscillospiraceae bacterium]